MPVTKQISVFLENRPGTFRRVTDALTDAGISIKGMTVSDTVDHAVVRLIVDDPGRCLKIFEERNLLAIESDILEIRLPDKVGMMSKLARALAARDINIDYAYGSCGSGAAGVLYLRVANCAETDLLISSALAS